MLEMRPMSRALVPLLMLALHGVAGAGPVPAAEADPAAAAPMLPSLSAPVLGAGMAAEAPASAASGSALAVEIIKEAEAGTTTTETPHGAKRDGARAAAAPVAPGATARNQPGTADDPWGLRDVGKAAVLWVKDVVPWLRSDEDARDADRNATLNTADWSASALEAGQAGRRAQLAANQPTGAPTVDPTIAVGYGDASQPKIVDPDQNLVRVVLNTLREVLEHPMTWLVMALFVIGGIVVKKIDRRPTE